MLWLEGPLGRLPLDPQGSRVSWGLVTASCLYRFSRDSWLPRWPLRVLDDAQRLQWFRGTPAHVLQAPGAQPESRLTPSVFIVSFIFPLSYVTDSAFGPRFSPVWLSLVLHTSLPLSPSTPVSGDIRLFCDGGFGANTGSPMCSVFPQLLASPRPLSPGGLVPASPRPPPDRCGHSPCSPHVRHEMEASSEVRSQCAPRPFIRILHPARGSEPG